MTAPQSGQAHTLVLQGVTGLTHLVPGPTPDEMKEREGTSEEIKASALERQCGISSGLSTWVPLDIPKFLNIPDPQKTTEAEFLKWARQREVDVQLKVSPFDEAWLESFALETQEYSEPKTSIQFAPRIIHQPLESIDIGPLDSDPDGTKWSDQPIEGVKQVYTSSTNGFQKHHSGISAIRGDSFNSPYIPGGFSKPVERVPVVSDAPDAELFPWLETDPEKRAERLLTKFPGLEDIEEEEEEEEEEGAEGEMVGQNTSALLQAVNLRNDQRIDLKNQKTKDKRRFRQMAAELASRPAIPRVGIASMFEDDSEDEESESGEDEKEMDQETSDLAEGDLNDLLTSSGAIAKMTKKPKAKKKPTEKVWAIKEELHTCENWGYEVPDPAIEYPFELDSFQKQAIMHLEKGESVFVAAHTSAGKTVIAEYAIALTQRNRTKTIYTSPIKTLSNQKYRDFCETFDSVGLVTGDVCINQEEANCLICTTEILRSMLYKGADIIRDIEWVVFDEAHYIGDENRGVVWEEVIIMLPDYVNIILLSATVKNTLEFADWVGRTKEKQIYVLSTFKRPVPLKHYLWCDGGLHCIFDKEYRRKGLKDAQAIKKEKNLKKKAQRGGGKFYKRTKNPMIALVQKLNAGDEVSPDGLLPVVIFCFSRRRCEQEAELMMSQDLTVHDEKSTIHQVFQAAVRRLHGNDKNLPQILKMRQMLSLGIGVHHAGLLPIVKEVVEIIFGLGLCKVLFATETFAMGVNMPTRTVVFEDLRKFDGKQKRELNSSEYIQMAGRAGRRGKDTFGMVILNCKDNEIPKETLLRKMLVGDPTNLTSRFRLTYNMILNLLRCTDLKCEDMVKRSFGEFATEKVREQKMVVLDKINKHLELLEKEVIEEAIAEDLEAFYWDMNSLIELEHKLGHGILKSSKLRPGRVIAVRLPHHFHTSIGVCVGSVRGATFTKPAYVNALVLCHESWQASSSKEEEVTKGVRMSGEFRFFVAPLTAGDIATVFQEKINANFPKINNPKRQDSGVIADALMQLKKLEKGMDEMPEEMLKNLIPRPEPSIHEAYKERIRRKNSLREYSFYGDSSVAQQYAKISRKNALFARKEELTHELSDANCWLMADFSQRCNFLGQLKYIDQENVVQLKGRVAIEINNIDSIVCTEMIFENVFDEMEPEDIAALMSVFVFQGPKTKVEVPSTLQEPIQKVFEIATRVLDLQLSQRVDIDESEENRENINDGLLIVVREWALGKSFTDITGLTDVQEGTIVRTISRLYESLRDIGKACRVIGDYKLFEKIETACEMIKRDIVFAASLYISPDD